MGVASTSMGTSLSSLSRDEEAEDIFSVTGMSPNSKRAGEIKALMVRTLRVEHHHTNQTTNTKDAIVRGENRTQ